MVSATPVGRRLFLAMVGATAAGVLFGARAQSGLERVLRPLTARDGTGLSSFLPTAGRFRIYSVAGFLPERSREEYRLDVDGLVDAPQALTYDDLLGLPRTAITADFQCVTGWRVADVAWEGVRLADVLDVAGVQDGATHLRFTSFDRIYTESLTLEQARRSDVLVAYAMLDDEPISDAHGGPVRLYVAPMYGYKSLKWLGEIEVVDRIEPGYWERRGYDVDAWIGRSNGRDDDPV